MEHPKRVTESFRGIHMGIFIAEYICVYLKLFPLEPKREVQRLLTI